MNCKNWLNIFFSIVLFTLIINFSLPGQSYYIEKYPGIPVIAHTNVSSSRLDQSQLQKMKDLGILGFYATNLTPESFQTITANNLGLKVFPYQIWSDSAFVVYYTDAMYTKWEAEGKGYGSDGDVELKHTSLGESFTEVDTSGIVTNSNSPGVLMYGPAYYQEIKYKEIPLDYDTSKAIVKYTANYRLKISQQEGIQLPQNYLNDTVCVLQIVATNPQNDTSSENYSTVLFAKGITVYDFIISGSGWDNWNPMKIEDYTLSSLKALTQAELYGPPPSMAQSWLTTTNQFDSRWMQYKVIWKGLNYLKLYVDYIEISDEKGRKLKNIPQTITYIKNYLNRYPAWNDTTYSLGWFGLNEPRTIDNFEPFRMMDSIIHSNNPSLHLYTTFTTGWMGIYGAPWPGHVPNGEEYKGTEFIKRSNLPYISYNNYIYNWPYYPSETNAYYLENINEITTKNLAKLKTAKIPISYSTQSGKFFFYDDSCHETVTSSNCHVPSNQQMNYHINLGLLFGMKELTCDPFFTLNKESNEACAGEQYRIGLVNFYDTTLTPLGQFWKDTIKPRMSGTVGKTIKALTPTDQHFEINTKTAPLLNYNFIKKIEKSTSVNSPDIFYVDLGFFSDTNSTDPCKKYFMTVNRYYSNVTNIKYTFKDLSVYKNWEVTNFITNVKTTIVTNTADEAEHTDVIPIGDAGLYSVLPVVKYGGTLAASDNISGSLQMGGNILVPTGVTLTLAANSVINPNGFSIVSTGGIISIQAGATINGVVLVGSTYKGIYSTMQPALSAAVPGQAVVVYNSQTVSGSFFIVPSGVTLSFTPNVVITFSSGRRISVYGNLTANGSTFRGNGTRGSWQGISFNSGSTGSIQSSTITDSQNGISFSGGTGSVQSSTITNGVIGIYMNNGAATIQGNTITNNSGSGISSVNSSNLTVTNCTLSNNGTGITANSITSSITQNSFLNNTNYGINATGISIYDYWYYNAFHGNGYAMVLNNASPWIAHDTICGNNHGVVINSSFPNFCTPEGGGFNAITYSTTPLFRADNSSTVVMGYWSQGGYNSVFGSELPDMEARNSSHIWADNTYWGSDQPAILADGTSWITTRTPLTYDPVPTICTDYSPQSLMAINSTAIDANVSSINSDKASKYAEAITSGREGHFQKARKSLLTLIDGEFDRKYSPLALLSFYEFTFKERYTKGKGAAIDSLNNELKDILAKVTKRAKEDSLRPFALRFLAREAALSNNTLEMLSYNKEIVANYPNSSNELSALFDLITYYTDVEQDVTKTDEYYTRMVKAYPDEDLTKFAAINLGKNKKNLKKGAFTEEEQLPIEYSLSNAYPNPFNPITTITYQIPKDGFVTLDVFDILGNKVTTLVNQQKVIGKYSVQFDASSLASGTYVYQLRVNDYTSTKKMLLLK